MRLKNHKNGIERMVTVVMADDSGTTVAVTTAVATTQRTRATCMCIILSDFPFDCVYSVHGSRHSHPN